MMADRDGKRWGEEGRGREEEAEGESAYVHRNQIRPPRLQCIQNGQHGGDHQRICKTQIDRRKHNTLSNHLISYR